MDFVDRHPASLGRPQAALRRAVRLARIAERYADPMSRNDTTIHRHDFLGEGDEYLSVAVTDPQFATEAHLTVALTVGANGRAHPRGGTLTLKGIADAGVGRLLAVLSPLPPVGSRARWSPRGGWWERCRDRAPGDRPDSLRDEAEAGAPARTGNGCAVNLYSEGAGNQLNVEMTEQDASAVPGVWELAVIEDQLVTLLRVYARWGAMISADREVIMYGHASRFPL